MCALKLGELEVEIGADTSGLKKAGREVKNTSKSMQSSFSALGKTIAAAITVDAVRRAVMIADNMRRLDGVVKRLTKTTGDFNSVWGELNKISDENGVAISDSIGLFQRFQMALKNVTDKNSDVLDFVDTLQKIGRIGGSSTQEMAGALTQLSQGFSGGIIRAEEWNSIIEQAPEILNVVAKNMKGVNGDVGVLRKRMLAGSLTAESFYKAISKGAETVGKEFKDLPRTIDMASTALSNNFAKAIFELDKQLGGSENIAKFFDVLAKGLSEFTADIKLKPLKMAQFELAKIDGEIKKINESSATLEGLHKSLEEATSGYARAAISKAIEEHGDKQGELKALDERRAALVKQISELESKPEGVGKGIGGAPIDKPKVISVDEEIKRLKLIASVYDNAFAEIEANILTQREQAIKLYGEKSKEFLDIDKQLNAKRITLRADAEKEIAEKSSEAKQRETDEEIKRLEKIAAENDKLRDEQINAVEKLAEQTAAAFEAMNNSIGDELGRAITNAQSFSDAFKNIMSALLSQLISAGITSAFGGAIGGGNVFAGAFGGATAGGNAFGGGSSPIAAHRVNERGTPEMLEQAGKQFLLPNGKGGKVTPLKSGGGGGQPNISMINMGTPMNVESVNITEDGVEVMINDKLAAFDKSLTAEMSKPNSSKSRALKNTFRLEQNMGR